MLAAVSVSNASDIVDGDALNGIPALISNPGADGTISLREATLAANQTNGPDTIDLSGVTGTINLTQGQMFISESVTITGPGRDVLTIDADDDSRIFNIDDVNGISVQDVSISGLTLTGGSPRNVFLGGNLESGGAITTAENLSLHDMRFTDNTASSGGAVTMNVQFDETISLEATNVELIDNEAVGTIFNGGKGGAVFTLGTQNVLLTNIVAHGNIAERGGGVINVSGNSAASDNSLTIIDSYFYDNEAGGTVFGGGGAVRAMTNQLTVTNSSFGVDAAIPGSVGNRSGSSGGAIYLQQSLTVDDDAVDIKITDSKFQSNEASAIGGAISILPDYESIIEIANTDILYNSTIEDGLAGGIYVDSSAKKLDLNYVQIVGNTAGSSTSQGSGIFNSGGGMVITHDPDLGNFAFTGEIAVRNSLIADNETSGNGGGLYAYLSGDESSLSIENTTISNNGAYLNGGGAYVGNSEGTFFDAGNFELIESTVVDNTAYSGDGGGVYLLSRDTQSIPVGINRVERSTIARNSAAGDGGGFWGLAYSKAPLVIRDSSIYENQALGEGGGLWLSGSPLNPSDQAVSVLNTTIAENYAKSGGGVATDGHGTVFQHTTITNNVAGPLRLAETAQDPTLGEEYTAGGGIYFSSFREDGDVTLDHTIVAGNRHLADEVGTAMTGSDAETFFPTTGLPFGIGPNATNDIGSSVRPTSSPPVPPLELAVRYSIIGTVGELFNTPLDSVPDQEVSNVTIVDPTLTDPHDTSLFGGGDNGPIITPSQIFLVGADGQAVLGSHGGPTQTVALLPTGIAVDRGDPNFSASSYSDPLLYDQRELSFRRVEDTPGIGYTTAGSEHFIDIGAYEVQRLRVIDVVVSGSQSTHDPYSFAEATTDPAWIAGHQLRTLPVGGADTVSVKFSRDVASSISYDDLTMFGLRTQNQPTVAPGDFSYDADTFTATWKLTGWNLADHYVIRVDDSVLDSQAVALDGDWVNPASISSTAATSSFANGSGNGTAGGSFQFVTTFLPSDANLNNFVEGADLSAILGNWGQPNDQLFADGDTNGDGVVDGTDLSNFLGLWGTNLQTLILPGDLDLDFDVEGGPNGDDSLALAVNEGMASPTLQDGDLDNDGDVDPNDLAILNAISTAFESFGLDLQVA